MKRRSQGFNGGKNLVVYFGKSANGDPRKQVIDICKKSWNELNSPFLNRAKKKVARINFEFRAKSCKWAGQWYPNQVLKIIDNHQCPLEFYKQVLPHELAHAWYNNESKVNPEGIQKFRDAVKILEPINDYIKDYKNHWGEDMYANEMHSAVCQYMYGGGSPKIDDNYNALIKAFWELHQEDAKL